MYRVIPLVTENGVLTKAEKNEG